MTAITAELKSQMISNARFVNRGSGRSLEELSAHLDQILSKNLDAESLAESLLYYGFISNIQAVKMSKGLDWAKVVA